MRQEAEQDIIAMSIRLNELKAGFDQAIREEQPFEFLQKVYAEIRELECMLNVLQWEARNKMPQRKPEVPRSDIHIQRRYRHVDEPPPLL